MGFNFSKDFQNIRELLDYTQFALGEVLGVDQTIVSKYENGDNPSKEYVEKIYNLAFSKGIRISRLKEMLYKEKIGNTHKLLAHGSKKEIEGEISISKGRANNDFGLGFYAGESCEQAISFISNFDEGSIYFLDFNPNGLKCKKYDVTQDWMLIIAYYRGTLRDYEDNPIIKKLVDETKEYDYIIAPIADNRMFKIINSFIEGEITDEQCKHCLAATNLGNQYVFKTEKAINNLKIIERSYVSKAEKKYYQGIKEMDTRLGDDKVKLARREYRGKGLYIDDILSK